MPTSLSLTDLRSRLAEALRLAEGGEPVVITRHGKPAAALIAADRLDRPPDVAGESAPAGDSAATAPAGSSEPTAAELLERAAAPSLRRIDLDLERLPAKLKPVLGLIRENLFQPRLTVQRIRRVLGIGANDLTTHFRAAAGAPIRDYLEDRRLECACRLLVDSQLDVQGIALLVGYRGKEVFSRALKRRYGVRPRIYRELGGRLSREAAESAVAGRAPMAPRHLAGTAALAPGAVCAACGEALEPRPGLRIFEDLAPICDRCGRQRAPALAGLLAAAEADRRPGVGSSRPPDRPPEG